MWVLDYSRDLEADFMAFYNLTPSRTRTELTGPEYLSLAYRVSAYGGVIATRMKEDDEDDGRRKVGGDSASLRADPVLAGLIDF